jgi:hypothetical protein
MSEVITCPHCHGEIPKGAAVCRGCQGEVEYGAPRLAKIGAFIVGAIIWANTIKHSPTLAFGAGIASAIVLLVFVSRIFRKRIAIRRLYRTR